MIKTLMIVFNLALAVLFSLTAYSQVDTHVHAYSKFHEETVKFLEQSKKNGIKKNFVFSFAYGAELRTIIGDNSKSAHDFIVQENNYIAQLQKDFPDQVLGFCSIPWGYKGAYTEISRCAKELNLKGLKVYPSKFLLSRKGTYRAIFADFSSNEIELDNLNQQIELAAENKMIFGVHSQNFDYNRVSAFMNQSSYIDHNDLSVIFLHGFVGQSPEVLISLKNLLRFHSDPQVFVELSGSSPLYQVGNPYREIWIKTLKYFGADKILFGSDTFSQFSGQESMLNFYNKIFSKTEMKTILEDNANKLLKYIDDQACSKHFGN